MLNILLLTACFLFTASTAQSLHGQYCTTNSDCATGFNCISNTCACPTIGQTYLNEKCVGLVGSFCDAENICIENAECRNSTGTCECLPNHLEGNDGGCAKSFGVSCQLDQECSTAGLFCIKGKCNCNDLSEVYYTENGINACAVGAGYRCRSSQYGWPYTTCVPNAQCNNKVPGVYNVNTRCHCQEPYYVADPETKMCVPNMTRRLELPFLAPRK